MDDQNQNAGGRFSGITSRPMFWELAFLFALVLLITSHKISIEGMIQ